MRGSVTLLTQCNISISLKFALNTFFMYYFTHNITEQQWRVLMPKVFMKDSKLKVIEYGSECNEDFALLENLKAKVIEFSKKLLAA